MNHKLLPVGHRSNSKPETDTAKKQPKVALWVLMHNQAFHNLQLKDLNFSESTYG